MTFASKARNTLVARGASKAEVDRIMVLVQKCALAAEQSPNVHSGKVANSIAKRIKDVESIEEMEKSLDDLYWFILGWEDSAE